MKVYSYSRLKQFLECPRKFRYHYKDGYVPAYDGVALPLGKAVHAAIEAMAKGASSPEALDVALPVLHEDIPEDLGEKDEQKLRVAEHQLRAIVGSYPRWEDGIEILATEQEVTAPMPYGRALKGILDLVVRVNKNIYTWDTKTTGDSLEKAAMGNRIRLQYPAYAVLTRHLLKESPDLGGGTCEVSGVVVDLIYKPRVHVRKDGSLTPNIKPLYHREAINVDDRRQQEFIGWFNHVTALIEMQEGDGLGDSSVADQIAWGRGR